MVGAMAETQRRPVPRNDGGELDTALAFLTFARESALIKTEGLATNSCAASSSAPAPTCWG